MKRVLCAEVRAAAVHEAAHVVAAFHWDVPAGERGVVVAESGRGVVGSAHMLHGRGRHDTAARICVLIAPFASFKYYVSVQKWDRERAARWAIGCGRGDFGRLWPRLTVATRHSYSEFCFAAWQRPDKKLDPWDRWFDRWKKAAAVTRTFRDKELMWAMTRYHEEQTRDLVHDADAMLQAYWEQILAFADALLATEHSRMTPGNVAQWRDAHFQRRDVALSGGAR